MKRQLFGVLALAAALLMIAAACTSGGSQTTRRTEAERGVDTEVESDAGGSAEEQCEEALDEAECELESALSGEPHPENIIEHLDGYESYFFGQRAAPATLVPPGAFQAALAEAAAIQSASARVLGATSTWQNAGPQPVNSEDPAYQDPVVNNFGGGWGIDSGRVTAIAVDPRNDDTVYMGAADGGVWKTTDGGATWTPLGDQLDTTTIGSIAIVPQNSNTLYVGTGEASTNSDAYFGLGVFKSTDGGASFVKIGGSLFDEKTVFKIVAPSKGLVFVATNQGLYRSKNGGSSFSLVLAPGDTNAFGNFVSDVITLDAAGKNVLAAIGWRGGAPSNGLYRSVDSGSTWTKLSPKGFPAQERLGRMTLAQAPSMPNRLFAVVQDAAYFNSGGPNGTVLNGVYRTSNGPTGTWTRMADSAELAADPGSAMDPDKIGRGLRSRRAGLVQPAHRGRPDESRSRDARARGDLRVRRRRTGVGHDRPVLELLLRQPAVAGVAVVQRGTGDRGEHPHHAPRPARRRLHLDR